MSRKLRTINNNTKVIWVITRNQLILVVAYILNNSRHTDVMVVFALIIPTERKSQYGINQYKEPHAYCNPLLVNKIVHAIPCIFEIVFSCIYLWLGFYCCKAFYYLKSALVDRWSRVVIIRQRECWNIWYSITISIKVKMKWLNHIQDS